jgi:hypothetical protein
MNSSQFGAGWVTQMHIFLHTFLKTYMASRKEARNSKTILES